MRWSYAVTTVPTRRATYLPRTLASLRAAGWDSPRLCVDGCAHAEAASYSAEFGLPVSAREPPPLLCARNWQLSAFELYLRDPWADRYAVFQDDVVFCRNLRQYLEACPYPEKGYLNLYCHPQNERLVRRPAARPGPRTRHGPPRVGWYESNQRGLGALALVFSREALTALFSEPEHWVNRPQNRERGWRVIDGGIVDALSRKLGWKEHVHYPSLCQHAGEVSTMTGLCIDPAKEALMPRKVWPPHLYSASFPGESHDAMSFLEAPHAG